MTEENQNLEENLKRHFDVVIEKVHGDFKVFGEQLTDVDKKVNGLNEKVDLLAEDMDYVKSEIVEIKNRFKETDEELAKKADKEIVENHEKRLVKLENATLAKTA